MKILFLTYVFILVSFATNVNAFSGNEDQLIGMLESQKPSSPQLANRDLLENLSRIAKTKRLDAAATLIGYLAINFEPGQSNEKLTDDMMLPALSLLKESYGQLILPQLYISALSSSEDWMINRLIIAIRSIANPNEIKDMNGKFSLSDSKNKAAIRLSQKLKEKSLNMYFVNSNSSTVDVIDTKLKALK